jgi:hypothetical protein
MLLQTRQHAAGVVRLASIEVATTFCYCFLIYRFSTCFDFLIYYHPCCDSWIGSSWNVDSLD